MAIHSQPRRLVDQQALPVNVRRTPQAESDHARAGRGIREAIDEDERARGAVIRVRIECDRDDVDRLHRPISLSASVFAAICSSVLTSTLCLRLVIARRNVLRSDSHQVRAAGEHRVLGHPQHVSGELIDDFRPTVSMRDDITASHVNLIGEGQSDRIAGVRFGQICRPQSRCAKSWTPCRMRRRRFGHPA